MSEEIKFDHFKDINELLKHIDLWYREDDIEYTRWFGLEDLYKLKHYIIYLQQKVEQLENIRKEAIKIIKKQMPICIMPNNTLIHGAEKAKVLENLLNILNKGSENNE